MKSVEVIQRRWKLENPKLEKLEREIIVPTLKEKIELDLSDEEWIMICFMKCKDSQCFREQNAQPLCSLCPKSRKMRIDDIDEGLVREIETLLAETIQKLVHKRHYRRR